SILSLLVLALLGGCSILGGKKAMEAKREAEKQEMIEIVESEEAKNVFKDLIKQESSTAFEKDSKIETYSVDLNSLEFSPMGGIMVTLYINGDEKLTLTTTLKQDEEKLYHSSYVISEELSKILE
ncbi:DUF1310 family protein, partial [Streptococcus caprae]